MTTSRTVQRTRGVKSYCCPALIINVANFLFLIRYLELWASATCSLNYLQATSKRYEVCMSKVVVAMYPKRSLVARSNIVPSQTIEIDKSYSPLSRSLLCELATSRNCTLDLEVSLIGRQFLNLDALRGLISFVKE